MAVSGAPFGTGFREPSPSVSALPGFNPSLGRVRSYANIIASFDAADADAARALDAAEDILRDILEAETPLRNQIPMGGML